MLTIFNSSGKSYSLWCHHFIDTTNKTGTNVEVVVTDGHNTWRSATSRSTSFNALNDKPVSRKHEDNEEFMRKVIKAMTSTDSVLFEVSFVDSSTTDPSSSQCLTIKIAEKMSNNGAKTLLFKGSLPLSINSHPDDTRSLSMELFQSISTKMKADEATISGLANDIDLYRQQINALHGDLKDLCIMKENLQNDLMLSMCMVLNTKKREIARLRNALSHSGLHLDDTEDPCEATTAAIHSGSRAGGNKKRRKDDDLSTVATEDIPVSPMAAPSSSITTPNSIAADSTRSAAPNSAIAVSKAAAPTRALSKKQQIEMMKQNLQANRNKQLLQSVAPVVAIDVKISPIKEAVNEKDSDDDNRGDECKYDESVCSVDQREDNRSISTDDTSFDNRRVHNHSSAVNHSISDRIVDHPLSTTISSQPEPSSSQVKNNVGSNRITSRFLAEDDSDSDN
jgi:hypothetical protein